MKPHLQDLLRDALQAACAELGLPVPSPNIVIDATKDKAHGDFASNLAMVCAKGLGQPPRKFAEALVRLLPASSRVAKVEIAGPGFINFFLTGDALTALVPEILAAGEHWGQDRSGSKGKVNVEFVSANPTGPMHVGHGRGAAYGDTLANLLAATGHAVHREYYINDAGRQVDVLTVSVWLRYLEAGGATLPFPKRGYPADYIKRSAAGIRAAHGEAFQHDAAALFAGLPAEPQVPEGADDKTKDAIKLQQEAHLDRLIERARAALGAEGYAAITRAALDDQLAVIRATLQSFNVRFDQWYSEHALVQSGFARTAIERLKAAGHVYEKDGAQWLKTSDYGDEKDRVLFKADGAATYFANDLAYHVDKLDRGYPLLVDVWGADHHGYIARVRAAIEMLTKRKDALHVALMQFVTLSSGRMGKRSGNFVTLQDLIDEVGADATRFFYLSRSHDQGLEFDIDLAVKQTNENPFFYVQYAYARICSVFDKTQPAQIRLGKIRKECELILEKLTEDKSTEKKKKEFIRGLKIIRWHKVGLYRYINGHGELMDVLGDEENERLFSASFSNWSIESAIRRMAFELKKLNAFEEVFGESIASIVSEEQKAPNAMEAEKTVHRLIDESEIELIKILQKYPETIRNAAANKTPHTVVFYLNSVAAAVHNFYAKCKILNPDDLELQNARLALIESARLVLESGLNLIGIKPERALI